MMLLYLGVLVGSGLLPKIDLLCTLRRFITFGHLLLTNICPTQPQELYYDALTFAMFFRHCRELALLCGLGNFSQSDLIRPDAHRLRTILSGIMNFAKFRDDRAHFYYDLVDKVNKDKHQ